MSKITNFWLVSVAEETGFSFALSETPKTGCYAAAHLRAFAENLSIGSKYLLHIKFKTFRTLRLFYIGNQNIQ